MPACKLYDTLARAKPGLVGSADWPANLPWLYYGINSNEAPSVTIEKTLNTPVSFSDPTNNVSPAISQETDPHFLHPIRASN